MRKKSQKVSLYFIDILQCGIIFYCQKHVCVPFEPRILHLKYRIVAPSIMIQIILPDTLPRGKETKLFFKVMIYCVCVLLFNKKALTVRDVSKKTCPASDQHPGQ